MTIKSFYMYLNLPFIVASFFLAAGATASHKDSASLILIAKAERMNLSGQVFWHKLLRYKENTFSSGFTSAVISTDYFVSPQGNGDPAKELHATIHGFFSKLIDPKKIDQHIICRFPARYKWIKRQLQWEGRDHILKSCIQYDGWNREQQITSVSLVFATGYFGNPASYFGHPLLLFNTGAGKNRLFDTSIHYGALVPENENPLLYMVRGLVGGYTASFTDLHYFYHNHNYSENELRDLWEYKLNFSQDQVDLLVDHSWEILGKKFAYRFLSDNCAYRMNEILELVFGEPIMPDAYLYSIPIVLFESIGSGTMENGQAFTREVTRFASRQSRMNEKFLALSEPGKHLVRALVREEDSFEGASYQSFPKQQKALVVGTIIDYYAFMTAKNKDEQSFKAERKTALLQRLALPTGTTFSHTRLSGEAPHFGPKSFMTRAGLVYSEKFKSGMEITIRPALYDILSPEVARPSDTELTSFDGRLVIFEDRIDLTRLDFFSMSTLHSSAIGLPGVERAALKLRIGLFSQTQDCNDCLVGGISGGAGKVLRFNDALSIYGLAGARIQTEYRSYGTIALVPEIGGIIKFSPSWKAYIQLKKEFFRNGKMLEPLAFEVSQRFGRSPNWDIRLDLIKKEDQQVQLSVAKYW